MTMFSRLGSLLNVFSVGSLQKVAEEGRGKLFIELSHDKKCLDYGSGEMFVELSHGGKFVE